MISIRIYVEGGGDRKDTLVKCRRGFAEFFKKIVPERNQPKIIACGGRTSAFKKFCIATRQKPQNITILLVDSEEPVNKIPWEHLKDRDKWEKPVGVKHDSVHLMVQCMESWFLADKEILREYYGQGFSFSALPLSINIEAIPKSEVQQGLDKATKPSKKGRYHKTKHAFDILALINPSQLDNDKVSVHAKHLIDYLKDVTAGNL